MVFIDSNVFMYAAGASHENKTPSLLFLHRVAAKKIESCTNTEVLQEVLHRYRHINRWDDGKNVYHLIKKIVPIIIPLELPILDSSYDLLEQYGAIYARDAIHAATCIIHNINTIISYDRDFDSIEHIDRQEPQRI